MSLIGWIVLLAIVVLLGGLVFWLRKSGNWERARVFVAEVRSEMKKVTFPTRDEVVATTIVVIVTSIFFAIFLWIADLLIVKGYSGLIKALST
jgi:preprotein translocase subunit SecE